MSTQFQVIVRDGKTQVNTTKTIPMVVTVGRQGPPGADGSIATEQLRNELLPQITDKANAAEVQQALTTVQSELDAHSSSIAAINQQLPNLATQTYVLTALTPKASIVYVDSGLATKADALATSQALATKATLTQLNEVKALAESNELKVSTKAEQSSVDNLSATMTAQGQTLLTKADIAALTTLAQLVDTKADQAYVISEIARITGNAPAALDTLAEIAEQLGNDETQINNLLNQIGNRVRFDAAQSLTTAQQNQALSNINAEKAGTAAALVGAITPASIGAATSAQGAKADTAIQSADLAPVALSGSFSDLVNKSSLFNLVYSAYAVGSNAVIAATDTLGQMLGKLQGQISANTSAIGTKADATSTLQAINTKEPAISTGTISQYWRGDKAWRDFATDVRGTVLTGLSTATATAITATDTVLIALGKAQAQITANSTAIMPVPKRIGTKWYPTGYYFDKCYPWPGALGAMSPTLGMLYLAPMTILENVTIDQLAINVSTAGTGASMLLGIYTSDANNEPTTLLFGSSNLSADTTGIKTTAANITLTAGAVVWTAFLATGASLQVFGHTPTALLSFRPAAAVNANTICCYVLTSQTTLPADVSAVSKTVSQLITLPAVRFRIA